MPTEIKNKNEYDSESESESDSELLNENGELFDIGDLITFKRFDKNKKYSPLSEYVKNMYPHIDVWRYFDEKDLPGSLIEIMYNNTFIEDEKNGKKFEKLVRYIDTLTDDEMEDIEMDYGRGELKFFLRLVLPRELKIKY